MDYELSPKPRPLRVALSPAQKAEISVRSGDFRSARNFLRQAIRGEPGNAGHRFRLGLVLQQLGNADGAAEQATQALKLDPAHGAAVRLLGEILGRGRLGAGVRLDPSGLLAALAHRTVDRDMIAAAVVHHLRETNPWQTLFSVGRLEGSEAAARLMLESKSRALLSDPLFLSVLEAGVVVDPDVEDLLTEVRCLLLLHIKPDRFAEPALSRFIVALIRQMWLNEHVFEEADDETAEIERIAAVLTAGADVPAAAVMRLLLYRSPDAIAALNPNLAWSAALPAPVREALAETVATASSIDARSRRLPQFSRLTGPVTTDVASQYEAAPYPRWTSIHVRRPGAYLEDLAALLGHHRVAFTAKPFDVLIAGCGTGRQAVSAAFDYGPNARILAFDIARRSVGYAAHMADTLGVTSIDWGVGDLTAIDQFEPSLTHRFQIVECTGVLHHTADLFGTWRKLIDALAPGGLMLIGLYSAVARRDLALLRRETAYPGAGAPDAQLRSYRAELRRRDKDDPSAELIRRAGRDFYSASGFRDFFLHVNERTTTLGEIDTFLATAGLTFRGFAWPPIEALRTMVPGEVAPGRLSAWAEFEARHPATFAGMYQFWCSRD